MSLREGVRALWQEARALPAGRRLLLALSGAGALLFLAWLATQGLALLVPPTPWADGGAALASARPSVAPGSADTALAAALPAVSGDAVSMPGAQSVRGEPRAPGSAAGAPAAGGGSAGPGVAAGEAAPDAATASGLPAAAGDDAADRAARTLAVTLALERALAARVVALLEPVLGAGRVVARVHADLDWSGWQETRERFDPDDTVVRSEERVREDPAEGRATALRRDAVQYDVGRSVRHEASAPASLKRLQVAVLLDEAALSPLGHEARRDLEEAVRRAVGLSSERGDVLTVSRVPFRTGWLGLPPAVVARVLDVLPWVLVLGLFALAARAFWLQLAAPPDGLPVRAGELAAALAPALPAAPEERASELRSDGDAASDALRAWLEED